MNNGARVPARPAVARSVPNSAPPDRDRAGDSVTGAYTTTPYGRSRWVPAGREICEACGGEGFGYADEPHGERRAECEECGGTGLEVVPLCEAFDSAAPMPGRDPCDMPATRELDDVKFCDRHYRQAYAWRLREDGAA